MAIGGEFEPLPVWTPGLNARAVIDSLPRAVIVTSVEGRILLWNKVAEDLYGWSESEVLGREVRDVLVSTQDHAQADQIMAALATGETWRGDFSVLRRKGDYIRVLVVDRPILGPDGSVEAIVGASEDITEQRLLEQRAADLAEHLRLALDAGELGTWRWDMATGEVVWDERLEALYGLPPGGFDGTFEAYVALLHPEDAAEVLAAVDEAVQSKRSYTVNHRVLWRDGTVRWIQGKGVVTFDETGAVSGTIGCVADVTEQMAATQARERAVADALEAAAQQKLSAQRLEFLGRINEALATAETRKEVMASVTRTAVPMLGEWCSIFVLPDSGSRIPDVEIAHTDPNMVAYAYELQDRFPYDPDAPTGIPKIIRTGEPEFYREIDEQVMDEIEVGEDARDLVRSLRLRSAIAVPLRKRGRVVGALQFVNTEESRLYTDQDFALAEAVAGRIASTLDNRRLTERHREIASTLQASLLPDALPSIPGVDLAVRYWAAGEGTSVGGDFYDAFDVDDHWMVVIGDVCGTGPQAAALTGLARHTIRTAAWAGASPVSILTQLNDAVLRSGRRTFCTVLICELRATDDGYVATVTAGGHPLPILRRSNGQVETVGRPGTLVGALPDAWSETVSTRLADNDTLVMYTDGVTDLPTPHGLDEPAIRSILSRATESGRTAEDVAERLGDEIASILPFSERNDDIALLVLRLGSDIATRH